jgi:hypothetical protein
MPDQRVRGYAVSTTLAHVMYGLETLHAVRGIQVDPEVTAALKHELKTWLATVVGALTAGGLLHCSGLYAACACTCCGVVKGI